MKDASCWILISSKPETKKFLWANFLKQWTWFFFSFVVFAYSWGWNEYQSHQTEEITLQLFSLNFHKKQNMKLIHARGREKKNWLWNWIECHWINSLREYLREIHKINALASSQKNNEKIENMEAWGCGERGGHWESGTKRDRWRSVMTCWSGSC